MADLKMNISPEVIIGSVNRVADEAVYMGSKAFIIADSSIGSSIVRIRELMEGRGISTLLFSDADPENSTFSLRDALSMARASHTDMIVGVGGVSLLNLARTTAALSIEDITVDEYFRGEKKPEVGLPYIEIPTSARNPFMVRNDALLCDGPERISRLCPLPNDMVKLAICDPTFLTTLGQRYTVLSMFDLMLHSCESFLSGKSNFFSDIQSREAIERLSKLLYFAVSKELEPTELNGVCEAGVISAFSNALTGIGPGTILSYVAASYTNNNRSLISAIILPALLDSPLYPFQDKKSQIAYFCRMDDEAGTLIPEEAAGAMRRFIGFYNLPARLSEVGVKSEQLNEIAAVAYNILESLYPDLSDEILLNILRTAY